MSEKSGSDKRIQERARVELDIDLGAYDRYYLSKLENVSIGGAFVRTEHVHAVGTEIKLRFTLPNLNNAIEMSGVVVWVYNQADTKAPNSTGMGIRFTNVRPEDQQRIAEFIAQRTKP